MRVADRKFLTLHERVLSIAKCVSHATQHLFKPKKQIRITTRERYALVLTQMSTLVLTLKRLYLSIISGGRYIMVVYFSYVSKTSSMASSPIPACYKVAVLAEPKSHNLNFLLCSKMFSTLISLCAIGGC